MSLVKESETAQTPAFQERVAMAVVHVAFEVRDEDPGTPDHTLRMSLARGLLAQNQYAESDFTALIAADSEVAGEDGDGNAAEDETIIDAIRRNWNVMAGSSQ